MNFNKESKMVLAIRKKINFKSLSAKQITVILLCIAFMIAFFMPIPFISAADDGDNTMPVATLAKVFTGIGAAIQEAMAPTSPIYQACIGDSSTLMTSTVAFRNILKSIAIFWVMSIAIMRCIHNIDQGKDPFTCVIKILLEIGFAGIIILYSDVIASLFVQLGAELVNDAIASGFKPDAVEIKINLGDNSVVNAFEKICETYVGSKAGQYVFNGMMLNVTSFDALLSGISQILAKFLVYQVLIEVGIRRIFCPLAVAEIYGEGLRSPGVRYIKKFVACFIKLIIAIASGWVAASVASSIVQGVLNMDFTSAGNPFQKIAHIEGSIMQLHAINFCIIGMIFKGGQLADEIVGI